MAYKVVYTEAAEQDLVEIIEYIIEVFGNTTAATKLHDALVARINELSIHPFIYELSRNERLARQGYRRLAYKSYVALYLIDKEQNQVNIARVFHAKRAYERII